MLGIRNRKSVARPRPVGQTHILFNRIVVEELAANQRQCVIENSGFDWQNRCFNRVVEAEAIWPDRQSYEFLVQASGQCHQGLLLLGSLRVMQGGSTLSIEKGFCVLNAYGSAGYDGYFYQMGSLIDVMTA